MGDLIANRPPVEPVAYIGEVNAVTTPNLDLDAEAAQVTELEPEGIRALRQEYSPERVEQILESLRQAIDDDANGRYITLAEYLERCGVTEDEVLDEYLEKRGMTRDDLK